MASSNKPRPGFRLLAITPPSGRIASGVVDAWVDAGARELGIAVVLREPKMVPKSLAELPKRFEPLVERCRAHEIPLLLSTKGMPESLEGIAGLHLRGDPDVGEIREIREAHGPILIGRSCHGAPQGGAELVDYTAVGPVFAPLTKTDFEKEPLGLAALRGWVVPQERIFALGGISIDTAGAALRTGAHGLAGISAFFGKVDRVVENVAAFTAAIRKLSDNAIPTPGTR